MPSKSRKSIQHLLGNFHQSRPRTRERDPLDSFPPKDFTKTFRRLGVFCFRTRTPTYCGLPIARWFPRQSRPKRAVVPLVSCSSRRKMGVPGTERQSQFPNSKPIRAQLQQNDGNLASPTAHQHVHEFTQIYSPSDDSTFISWISRVSLGEVCQFETRGVTQRNVRTWPPHATGGVVNTWVHIDFGRRPWDQKRGLGFRGFGLKGNRKDPPFSFSFLFWVRGTCAHVTLKHPPKSQA